MSKGMRTVIIAVMLVIGLGTGNMAVADPLHLISVDDATFGPGSITRDLHTGLDWLDLPLSTGRSFNDINSQLGVGGEFEGFHHASGAEVLIFYSDAGITTPSFPEFSVLNGPPIFALFNLWGIVDDNILGFGKSILFFISGGTVSPNRELLSFLAWRREFDDGRACAACSTFDVDEPSASVAHGLVRPTPASELSWPEPATSVLLLLGLVMGGLTCRKRALR